MNALASFSVHDALQRVHQLEPLLREHAAACERERRLVDPVASALRAAGLYRLYVPQSCGGYAFDALNTGRIVEALAGIDSAAAWNVGLAAGGVALLTAFFDPRVAERIFAANPDTVCAGSTAAPIVATRVKDGYRIDGQIRFVSGAHQADWIVAMAIQMQDGQPVAACVGDGPALYFVCLPRAAVTVLDTWHVSAMRGTGSTDVAVDAAHIDAEYLVSVEQLVGEGRLAGRLIPWDGVHFESVVSIGIARAALRDLTALAASKVATGPDSQPIRHRWRVQHNLAYATALVDGARAYLRDAMRSAMSAAKTATGTLPAEVKIGLQLSSFLAADAGARAVACVNEAAGTSAARLDQRFERYTRDVELLRKHASKSTERLANVGKLLLGMPAGWPSLDL